MGNSNTKSTYEKTTVTFKYKNSLNSLHRIYGGINMVSITLAIPEEMKLEMESYPEINWSAVAREAIKKKLSLLKEMDRLLQKSTLTETDTIELGRKVNKAVAQKYYA